MAWPTCCPIKLYNDVRSVSNKITPESSRAKKKSFSEVLYVICAFRRNTEANEATYLAGEMTYVFPNWIQTTECFEFTSAVTANCVSTKSWRRVVRGVAGNRAEHNDVMSKPTWELTAGWQLTMNKLRQLTFVPSVRSACPLHSSVFCEVSHQHPLVKTSPA